MLEARDIAAHIHKPPMFSVSSILSPHYSYCPALLQSPALVTRRKTSVALYMRQQYRQQQSQQEPTQQRFNNP